VTRNKFHYCIILTAEYQRN